MVTKPSGVERNTPGEIDETKGETPTPPEKGESPAETPEDLEKQAETAEGKIEGDKDNFESNLDISTEIVGELPKTIGVTDSAQEAGNEAEGQLQGLRLEAEDTATNAQKEIKACLILDKSDSIDSGKGKTAGLTIEELPIKPSAEKKEPEKSPMDNILEQIKVKGEVKPEDEKRLKNIIDKLYEQKKSDNQGNVKKEFDDFYADLSEEERKKLLPDLLNISRAALEKRSDWRGGYAEALRFCGPAIDKIYDTINEEPGDELLSELTPRQLGMLNDCTGQLFQRALRSKDTEKMNKYRKIFAKIKPYKIDQVPPM
jgi:hypothetical protein